jgi:hypothetical protein
MSIIFRADRLTTPYGAHGQKLLEVFQLHAGGGDSISKYLYKIATSM